MLPIGKACRDATTPNTEIITVITANVDTNNLFLIRTPLSFVLHCLGHFWLSFLMYFRPLYAQSRVARAVIAVTARCSSRSGRRIVRMTGCAGLLSCTHVASKWVLPRSSRQSRGHQSRIARRIRPHKITCVMRGTHRSCEITPVVSVRRASLSVKSSFAAPFDQQLERGPLVPGSTSASRHAGAVSNDPSKLYRPPNAMATGRLSG